MYFPDREIHFTRLGDDVKNYQRAQREKAFEYVVSWKLAIDVGAQVGIFSRHFAEKFETVWAFEPVEENRECLALNTPDNVVIKPYACGDTVGSCIMCKTSISLGGSYVSGTPGAEVWKASAKTEVEMVTIDSLGLQGVNLIKIDVQGGEFAVLAGAAATLKRCKPIVLIEEKPIGGPNGDSQGIERAARFLESIGFVGKERVSADRIYVAS